MSHRWYFVILFCLFFAVSASDSRPALKRRCSFLEKTEGSVDEERCLLLGTRRAKTDAGYFVESIRQRRIEPFLHIYQELGLNSPNVVDVFGTLVSEDDADSAQFIFTCIPINWSSEKDCLLYLFDRTFSDNSIKFIDMLVRNFKELFLENRSLSASAAIFQDRPEIARVLIDNDFKLPIPKRRKIHPFHYAIRKNQIELVTLLLEKDPTLVSLRNRIYLRSCLFFATSVDMVKTLLKYRACPFDVDVNLTTVFEHLAKYRNPEVARALLSVNSRLKKFIDKTNVVARPKFVLLTSRMNVLENAFYSLFNTLESSRFLVEPAIRYHDEDAVDFGGPFRGWAALISERLFQVPLQLRDNPRDLSATLESRVLKIEPEVSNFKVFSAPPFVLNDSNYYIPNVDFDGPIEIWKFIGYFFATCLLKKIALGVQLAPSVLKKMLGLEVDFTDLEDDDQQLYNSLAALRDPAFDFDGAVLTFPDEYETLVNRDNLELFLTEKAREVLELRYFEQLQGLVEGFHLALDCDSHSLLPYFSWQDLGNIFNGETEISVDDLCRSLRFFGSREAANGMLITALRQMSQAELRLLIKFITGNEHLPFGGVKSLVRPINVYESDDNNFRASTCFFNFYIPIHCETADAFLEQLLASIASVDDFMDVTDCLGHYY